jgi:hypothetical protein
MDPIKVLTKEVQTKVSTTGAQDGTKIKIKDGIIIKTKIKDFKIEDIIYI